MLYDTVGSTLLAVLEPELGDGERSPIATAAATARVRTRSEADHELDRPRAPSRPRGPEAHQPEAPRNETTGWVSDEQKSATSPRTRDPHIAVRSRPR